MRPAFLRLRLALPLALLLMAVGSAGMLGLWRGETAEAQSAACSNAPFGANVEAGAGVAFVDVGSQTASFVCINSDGFSGGSSGPLTADGTYGGGCYFVEGLGTSVVAVYWELPDVRPDCQMIEDIDVGTGSVPSSTATQPPATVTQPPATQPPATATAAATQPPATATQMAPTATATRPPATATTAPAGTVPAAPTTRPPLPPATGNGEPSAGNSTLVLVGLGALLLTACGAAILARRRV